ncbi:MAG TPA: hypothetical protein PLB62_14310 [Candidatus Sumerlaeota bacterium]|nr:hypothetical protein [Candidatus Sumerlaeota bacterium]
MESLAVHPSLVASLNQIVPQSAGEFEGVSVAVGDEDLSLVNLDGFRLHRFTMLRGGRGMDASNRFTEVDQADPVLIPGQIVQDQLFTHLRQQSAVLSERRQQGAVCGATLFAEYGEDCRLGGFKVHGSSSIMVYFMILPNRKPASLTISG